MIQVIKTKSVEFTARKTRKKSWFIPPSKGIFCDSWTQLAFFWGLAWKMKSPKGQYLSFDHAWKSQEVIQHTHRKDLLPKKINPLRIQICPKKGISPVILLWGWDLDHQTYSREGYGSLGIHWAWLWCFFPRYTFVHTHRIIR